MPQQQRSAVAVTGVTGALGSRVAARLSERGIPQLLIGRNPERMPDLPGSQRRGPAAYLDTAAMRTAQNGASTLVLVSSHPTGQRLEEHASAVRAAAAVGVRRVLYVSLLGASPTATYRNARDHWLTEQFLAGTGLRCTVLRAGIYASTPAALADDDLVVRGPGGTGEVAFVTHDDLAAVLAELAADEDDTEHDGRVLEVTGPEAMTLADGVERIAEATGRPYLYQPETLEEAFAWRWRLGESGAQIEAWISWYQAIAGGELSAVTDAIARVTGSPATPIDRAGWWPAPKTAW